jgi:acetyl esterase/lipase
MAEPPSTPRYLNEFIVEEPVREPIDDGGVHWYLPDAPERRPAVVFVHGGPVRPEMSPKDWPVYRGYASMAARHGLVGVAFNHPFHGIEQMRAAAGEIARVLTEVREHDRVDPHRIGLWAFSGAGLFAGRFLDGPSEWLRALALTYPDCRRDDEDDDWPTTLAEAVEHSSDLPILLTRVGREESDLAGAVEEFVQAARGAAANLTVIDVPDGEHGFDHSIPTEEAQAAVVAAMTWMVERLGS